MKNKILTVIIAFIFMLSVPVLASDNMIVPVDDVVLVEDTVGNPEETVQKDDEVVEDIPAVEKQEPDIPYKKPISKRRLIKKFLLAMLAVGLSSVVLYFGLTVYNRFREGLPVQVKTPEGETPLSVPTDAETAVKTFLDKTRWN